MDINQTQFHLIAGQGDWGRCRIAGDAASLGERWAQQSEASDPASRPPPPPLAWDAARRAVRLASRVSHFRAPRASTPLPPEARRGAARDRYGHWYWIDPARQGIRFLPAGAVESRAFWSQPQADAARCVVGADFASCAPASPAPRLLSGLAVTSRHYLVVGDLAQRGLLLFDLHGGGEPLLLRWPADQPFAPWDIAATPDGGLLILDREHQQIWRLDQNFRVVADLIDGGEALFQPADPALPRSEQPDHAFPRATQVDALLPGVAMDLISIEPGPGGSVLLLDSHPSRSFSQIYVLQRGALAAVLSLEDAVEVADDSPGGDGSRAFSVRGHDMAYLPPSAGCGCGCGQCKAEGDMAYPLYVAEQSGNQVFAFALDQKDWDTAAPPTEVPPASGEYLPLRRWGAKALVAAGDTVFYDFRDRWVPLAPFVECHYEQRAVIETALPPADIPGAPFDSATIGCVWHRLTLDAQIPAGTAVRIEARAADDLALLEQMLWLPQPALYLRGDGAELPFYAPWDDLRGATAEERDQAGTWELLFQELRGRYIQLRLTILGSGRATPTLRALRAWFPRFSYAERYLPAIYREEPSAASFMERFLANFEGFYTALEEKIEHSAALIDPRSAPPETLGWLGAWLGISFDPLWSEQQNEQRQRFFIRHAERFYRTRGTVAGLLSAVRLYLGCTIDERVFDEAGAESVRVRVVERFRTRGVGGLAYGDPTEGGDPALVPLTPAHVAASAHRFTLLVPHDLPAQDLAMVERIVALEQPAHTMVELKRYWDLFRVGEARLGVDTALGESGSFVATLLGEGYLAETYLEASYPFDLEDRMISDRDMLGELPAL